LWLSCLTGQHTRRVMCSRRRGWGSKTSLGAARGSAVARTTQSAYRERERLLSGKLHDLFFSMDEIEFDRNARVLSIPIHPEKRLRFGQYTCDASRVVMILRIPLVQSFRVKDTEQIGWYDINRIRLDHNKREVEIIGNPPLRITCEVDDVLGAEIIACDDP
jgi:hypothetical protein